MLTLDSVGTFTWGWNDKFHIETDSGNYEWSDPSYNGDNTIKPTVPYLKWCELRNIPFGRDKGTHRIRDYCGDKVVIVE